MEEGVMFRTCRAVFLVALGFLCAVSVVSFAQSQVEVRGVSVYGMSNEAMFPVIVRDTLTRDGKPAMAESYITVQFDILAAHPPSLKIRFLHCDRNWAPDENLFVQDEHFNTSFNLEYRVSPGGVEGYKYRYVNRFPDAGGVVRFTYSGNWLFRIMDRNETTVFAEGRFFVVDNFTPTTLSVANDYLTANESPLNQIHRVTVAATLADETEGYFYTTIDVYQNRRLYNPYRIDAYDSDPYTTVEGFASGSRTFIIRNILPGNEYRTLDLSNATRYPNRMTVRLVEGVDQHRRFLRAAPDRNGIPQLNRFTGINSDYLTVMFRLQLTEADRERATRNDRGVYLVGPFNDWFPYSDDVLEYSAQEDLFIVYKTMRRGIYDYQYITGAWNEGLQEVVEQDWVELEGNDWRTSNIYSAFVYYNDPRFGGFDRIVGYATGASSPALPGSH